MVNHRQQASAQSHTPEKKIFSIILAVGCLLSNFTFTYIAGFPLNASFIAFVALFIISLMHGLVLQKRDLIYFCILILFVLINGIGSQHSSETIKSIAQIIFMATCLLIMSPWRRNLFDLKLFGLIFVYFFAVHSTYLIAQFYYMNSLADFSLQNPLGAFSAIGPKGDLHSTPGPYLPDLLSIIKRPNGLFSEPSVAALYTMLALSFCISIPPAILRYRTLITFILGAGVIITFSLSGLFVLISTLFILIIISARTGKLQFSVAFVIFIFMVTLMSLFFIGTYAWDRLNFFNGIDPAIYIRLVGPINFVIDILQVNIFGLPINDPSYLIGHEYLFDWQGRNFTSFDNFYIWILVYFGFPGAIFIFFSLYFMLKALLKYRLNALPLFVMFAFAFGTGGVYSSIFMLPLIAAIGWIKVFPR